MSIVCFFTNLDLSHLWGPFLAPSLFPLAAARGLPFPPWAGDGGDKRLTCAGGGEMAIVYWGQRRISVVLDPQVALAFEEPGTKLASLAGFSRATRIRNQSDWCVGALVRGHLSRRVPSLASKNSG